MTNYFGIARLKKIFYIYVSNNPDIKKAYDDYVNEFGKKFLFRYRKHRGSEFLDCSFLGYDLSFYAFGVESKCITLDVTFENNDLELCEKVDRVVSYYWKDFLPHPDNKNKILDCYDIVKKFS